MGIGLAIFSTDFSRFSNLLLLWIFIAYIVLVLIIDIVFIIVRCSKKPSDKECGNKTSFAVKMKTEGDGKVDIEKEDNIKEKKTPAPDSPIRWMLFGVYLVISVVFVFVCLVLVALPQ